MRGYFVLFIILFFLFLTTMTTIMPEVLNSTTFCKQYLKALVCVCDCALRSPY